MKIKSEFEKWKKESRAYIQNKISPDKVHWSFLKQNFLFDQNDLVIPKKHTIRVPQEFMKLSQSVACHRRLEKWDLLYRVLWRLIFEDHNLLQISIDKDISLLHKMVKEVRRDSHKMKAFVRFRLLNERDETYVAWHDPSHFVLERTAPFFKRRFSEMKWAILTPDLSVYWDKKQLQFVEGIPRDKLPQKDEMEELWKTFYRHIFNPARIKVKMMKSEMPRKYWHTMPETALIPKMLEEADEKVKKMIKNAYE